jgi:hypothetical protein
MIGSLFSLADVDDTKEGLVDTEALRKDPQLSRSAKKSDLRQLHRKLIKTDINLYHNRPATGVAVDRGNMATDSVV